MSMIHIEATEKTPEIILDDKNLIFEMIGKSRPENIRDFYKPIIEKLENFLDYLLVNTPAEKLEEKVFKINFKLGYFNSASAKCIADIMIMVHDFIKQGSNIKIYWYYQEGDDDMLEAGEEFSEMINIPINYIMIAEDKI